MSLVSAIFVQTGLKSETTLCSLSIQSDLVLQHSGEWTTFLFPRPKKCTLLVQVCRPGMCSVYILGPEGVFLLERCLPCDGADSEILMSKTIWQSDSLIMLLCTQLPNTNISLSLSLSFLSLSLSLSHFLLFHDEICQITVAVSLCFRRKWFRKN